jgi:hypothetical protein
MRRENEIENIERVDAIMGRLIGSGENIYQGMELWFRRKERNE